VPLGCNFRGTRHITGHFGKNLSCNHLHWYTHAAAGWSKSAKILAFLQQTCGVGHSSTDT